MDGYSVRVGVAHGVKEPVSFPFTLATPERVYNLATATECERDEWIQALERVMERPLTPQDSTSTRSSNQCFSIAVLIQAILISVCARLVRKRANTNSINIFSAR